MGELSLLGFAEMLTGIVVEYDAIQYEQMERATKVVQEEAKRVLGTYDYSWPQLAQATQEDRTRKGFTPNEPGLRTHEMRESIDTNVSREGSLLNPHFEGRIGSNEDRAVYFEIGTNTQPPRPFLMGAARHVEHEVVKILGDGAVKPLLEGRGAGP